MSDIKWVRIAYYSINDNHYYVDLIDKSELFALSSHDSEISWLIYSRPTAISSNWSAQSQSLTYDEAYTKLKELMKWI